MNIKDVGKGLRKLGKSKIAKEITEEVTDESLESITNGLLEKNKELRQELIKKGYELAKIRHVKNYVNNIIQFIICLRSIIIYNLII